jgi:hypothetical protein
MARIPEWSITSHADELVHRLGPRDSAVASTFMHRSITDETEKQVKRAFTREQGEVYVESECGVRIDKGSIGTNTITCIACIALRTEPT